MRSISNETTTEKFEIPVITTSDEIKEPFLPKIEEVFQNKIEMNFQNEIFKCPPINDLIYKSKNSNCSSPIFPAIYNSTLYPLYQPHNPGPSTQTNGFRHILLLAIQLKKSLFISYFTKHKSDSLSKFSKIPFGLRIDIENLCQFIEIKDSVDLEWSDNNKLENIVNLLAKHPNDKGKLDDKYGIQIYLNNMTDLSYDIENLNFIDLRSLDFDFYPRNSLNDLNHIFADLDLAYDGQNKNLIGIANPHYWIWKYLYKLIDAGGTYRMMSPILASSRPPKFSQKSTNFQLNSDYNLIKNLYKYTSHPKFIKTLAQKFINKYIGQNVNYVGVHFRFNTDFLGPTARGDKFMQEFIESNQNNTDMKNDMDSLKKFVRNETSSWKPAIGGKKGVPDSIRLEIIKTLQNPLYFLEKFIPHILKTIPKEKLLRRKGRNSLNSNVITIFMASPPNIAHYFEHENLKILKIANYTIKIVTSTDSKKFLESDLVRKYENCGEIMDDYLGRGL